MIKYVRGWTDDAPVILQVRICSPNKNYSTFPATKPIGENGGKIVVGNAIRKSGDSVSGEADFEILPEYKDWIPVLAMDYGEDLKKQPIGKQLYIRLYEPKYYRSLFGHIK